MNLICVRASHYCLFGEKKIHWTGNGSHSSLKSFHWNIEWNLRCSLYSSSFTHRKQEPYWNGFELGVYKIVPSLGRAGWRMSFQKWFQKHFRITLANTPTTVLGSRNSRDIALPHFLFQVSRGCFSLAKDRSPAGLRAVRESGNCSP